MPSNLVMPVDLFNSFRSAFEKWEGDAFLRNRAWTDSETNFYVIADAELRELLKVYCTQRCIQSRADCLGSLGRPSRYGLRGGNVIDCQITDNKARITTQGSNKVPDSDRRDVYLLVLEDGQWKIDSKKEISERGRERKVDLF